MAFFKPQRLEWEDIEGGVGENMIDEIWNFANDYGYGEHTFDNDESLNNELSDFAEEWSMLMNYTADEKQVMGHCTGDDYDDVCLYFGSSTYDRAEMARLLDDLIEDAEALGIETKSPEEVDRLLSLWQCEDVSSAGK